AGISIRNGDGKILHAFTLNLGKCSITRAELTDAVTGLQKAWELGYRRVEIQTDSSTQFISLGIIIIESISTQGLVWNLMNSWRETRS
ncbi:hypothetical protein LINPERHAP1_LOCUS16173, partial [Linum perenne]